MAEAHVSDEGVETVSTHYDPAPGQHHTARPKIRIEADGDPIGTRVLDDEGKDLSSWVTGVRWSHDAGGIPELELDLGLVPVTVEGRAKMIGPNGKEVRSIQYTDGTEDRFDGVVSSVCLDGNVRKHRVE